MKHMITKRKRILAAVAGLAIFAASCHNGGAARDAVPSAPGGGGSVPNGSDPKVPGVTLVPQATIPWQPSPGVPGIGLGIGKVLEGKQSVFAPFFEFVRAESSPEFSVNERTERRTFSSSSNVGVSASGGFALFSAGVAFNSSSQSSSSQSNYEFEGFLRLIKERRYLSAAQGHYALLPAVQVLLSQAQQARNLQDWNALNNVKNTFEGIYGIGFVSQHVAGYSMSLHAYGNVAEGSSTQASSFQATIRTPWFGGGFNNESTVASAAANANMTLRSYGRGLNVVITSIADFYATVNAFKQFIEGTNPNPSSIVAAPDVLWAGISEYRDLPDFAVLYDPIPGPLFAAVDTPISSQSVQIPVLGAVGELLSLGSFARNPSDSVWLSPYLFPGDYSASPGVFNLNVRAFDLLKQLSRDTAFRQFGESFLASLGYYDANAARPIIMPVSPGGAASEFPEHAGPFYKANVQRIRPVLYLTQPGNPNPVRIAPDDANWRLVGPMGLGNFGGPGSNTCGLFFGAGSLAMQFADPNQELANGAASGRLFLATEVSRGTQTIELSQKRAVTGDFRVDVWNPSTTFVPGTGHSYYPGNKKVVLVRYPVQSDWRTAMNVMSAPMWASTVRMLSWQENQDIVFFANPPYRHPGYLSVPIVATSDTTTGGTAAFWPATSSDMGSLNPAGFGPFHDVVIYGNSSVSNGVNAGTFLDILLLGQ